jgi:hypothetical protein
MKLLTFPIAQSKKSISIIVNSNKLKSEVKILYPNKIIVDLVDLLVIEKMLDRNYLNYR